LPRNVNKYYGGQRQFCDIVGSFLQMKRDTLRIVQWIVWYASSCEVSLTRLRLVKFLYLADLFFARETSGEVLTDLPWAFVHYGPYCNEAVSQIDAAVNLGLIEEEPHESKYGDKDFYSYRTRIEEQPVLPSDLPTYVSSELKWAIKKWGEDSGGLLDYVYFETEPMHNVNPGDLLDFSHVRKPVKEPQFFMRKLPKKKLEEARQAIRKLTEKTLVNQAHCRLAYKASLYDEKYFHFLTLIEEPDLETGLDGVAELQ
jgi:hypothetical protein